MTMTDAKILNRVRGWLGYGEPSDAAPAPDHSERHASAHVSARANLGLIDEITDFHHAHGLGVSADSLAFAYDLITGSDPRLAGQVNGRLRERLPIDVEWIEQTRRAARNDDSRAITTLRERLEKSIREFSQTTRDARSATSDYQNVLQVHVDELGAVNKAGEVITELANVAKAMLDRTRDIEDRMARSERETRQLQRRLEEAKRSAEVDHLTGLPNRRAFMERLTASAVDGVTPAPLFFLMLDIDDFKHINDSFGHDVGDRVLVEIAKVLREQSLGHNVARLGGEEFAVAAQLPNTAAAQELAQRIVDSVHANQLYGTQLSISVGLADHTPGETIFSLMRRADQALYDAKHEGKNRYAMATKTATNT